jgi:putative hydrolase of the HAD superfamily
VVSQVRVAAVTFDAGQTLVELDTRMLADRLAERGIATTPDDLDRAGISAWNRYDTLVRGGALHPWKALMDAWLDGIGVATSARGPIVDWLWTEQPARNLWRRPVAGMIELVGALRARGIRVGVVSNSEGRLAELFDEIGWRDRFDAIADSGRIGIDKPDPAIFGWALDRLGVQARDAVHVGDSHAADIDGARRVGMRAIWFGPHAMRIDGDPGVAIAADAAAVRAALAGWGVAL